MPRRILEFYAVRLNMFSRNIRLLLMGDACIGIGMTFWMLLFNLYLRKMGAGLAMNEAELGEFVGRTNAIAQVAAALFALPAGWAAGRFRLKWILILGHALAAVSYAGAVLAEGPRSMHASLFMASGFAVFFWVVTGPFTMRNTGPQERTYVFSIAFTLRLVGGILGNVLAGSVKDWVAAAGVAELTAYRWTILGGVAFSLLALLPFLLIREAAPRREGPGLGFSWKALRGLDWPFFAKALLPASLVSVGAGLIVQFMNLYLKDTFPGLQDSRIGLIMSLSYATMVFGMLAAPALAERSGKVRTIVWTQLASIPFMLTLALTRDLRLAVLALVVRASLMNMGGPVSNALVMELCAKEQQGILSALFTLNWNLSWAVAALLYGRMRGDYRMMFFIAIGLYLASTGLFQRFFRDAEAGASRRRQGAPGPVEPCAAS